VNGRLPGLTGLGALLDAVAHGLRGLPRVRFEKLMADFALWAMACETAFWPAGTFTQTYRANRRATIEDLIDADPVAAWVRQIMANRSKTGSASDLLRAGAALAGPGLPGEASAWPKSPGNSPADCVVRGHSCGYWASKSDSVVKAELEPE
jgi:hypothetical protein